MTVLVGANNAGKTSVVEAFEFLQKYDSVPPLTESRRNRGTYGQVRLDYGFIGGSAVSLQTPAAGGETWSWIWSRSSHPDAPTMIPTWVVGPQRGAENWLVPRAVDKRQDFRRRHGSGIRELGRRDFANRLRALHDEQRAFNDLMASVWGSAPKWMLEPADPNNQTSKIQFRAPGGSHGTEGVGSGLLSLFQILDAFFDADQPELIVIDEPELALHPAVQRRLLKFVAEQAKVHQVVLATHSPFFVDWKLLANGGRLARLSVSPKSCSARNLSRKVIGRIAPLATNPERPHTFGADAKEVLFLDDGIILVEGQEDVWGYSTICDQLGVQLNGTFYGWGCDGAGNMQRVAELLAELGFERVTGILDSDQAPAASKLRSRFPQYAFFVSPALDVRTKPAVTQRAEVKGALDKKRNVRRWYRRQMRAMLDEVAAALASNQRSGAE